MYATRHTLKEKEKIKENWYSRTYRHKRVSQNSKVHCCQNKDGSCLWSDRGPYLSSFWVTNQVQPLLYLLLLPSPPRLLPQCPLFFMAHWPVTHPWSLNGHGCIILREIELDSFVQERWFFHTVCLSSKRILPACLSVSLSLYFSLNCSILRFDFLQDVADNRAQ